MQFQKLTREERSILRWRKKRNQLVAKLMGGDKTLTSSEALKLANRQMGPMPGKREKW